MSRLSNFFFLDFFSTSLETKAAFVRQNEHHCGREKQELASNIHRDDCIRSHGKRHCAFRLLNTLFSNKLVGDLASLRDVIGKDDLADKQKNEEPFWAQVEEAFIDPDDDCGKPQFTENTCFKGGAGIDQSDTEPHNWEKL